VVILQLIAKRPSAFMLDLITMYSDTCCALKAFFARGILIDFRFYCRDLTKKRCSFRWDIKKTDLNKKSIFKLVGARRRAYDLAPKGWCWAQQGAFALVYSSFSAIIWRIKKKLKKIEGRTKRVIQI
jgi:hypothetical protein